MNITMRISHLAACWLGALAPGLASAAISLAPPSLPPCAFADTESSSNFVFCTGTGLDRNWILAIEADVSSNNNVQVEFGVDRDGSGALSVDERDHNTAEILLQRRMFIKLVESDLRISISFKFDNNPHSFAIRFIADLRDTFNALIFYKISNSFDQTRLIDLIRNFRNYYSHLPAV